MLLLFWWSVSVLSSSKSCYQVSYQKCYKLLNSSKSLTVKLPSQTRQRFDYLFMSVELGCCLKSVSCSPWQAGSRLCVCASISTAIPKMEREGGWVGGGSKRMKYWLALLKAEACFTLCSRRKQKRGRRKARVREWGDWVHSQCWQWAMDLPVGVCSSASACV